MSGHSKWSTIKHKKAATDQARGKLFGKLSKAIAIAIKTGGGNSPETNYQLRMAIDIAKSANMPKANIERILAKADEANALEEIVYEGFGPGGINVIVEAATDNRNRTSQEVKGIFEKGGGQLAGPGAVSFNFENKGLINVKKQKDTDNQILKMIDLGAEDVEETDNSIEVYVEPSQLTEMKDKLVANGFEVSNFELFKKPKNLITISDKEKATKVIDFLNKFEDHEDVQKVYANINIADEVDLD